MADGGFELVGASVTVEEEEVDVGSPPRPGGEIGGALAAGVSRLGLGRLEVPVLDRREREQQHPCHDRVAPGHGMRREAVGDDESRDEKDQPRPERGRPGVRREADQLDRLARELEMEEDERGRGEHHRHALAGRGAVQAIDGDDRAEAERQEAERVAGDARVQLRLGSVVVEEDRERERGECRHGQGGAPPGRPCGSRRIRSHDRSTVWPLTAGL